VARYLTQLAFTGQLLACALSCSLRDLSDLDSGGANTATCTIGTTDTDCIPLKSNLPYYLHPTHAPTKCITLPTGSLTTGTTLVQYDCESTIIQKFWLEAAKDGGFFIRSAWSGLCLQASAASNDPAAAIVQDNCLDLPSRHWSVVQRKNGFSLVQSQSTLVLDVAGNAVTSNGAPLEQSPDDGSPDMVWQFEQTSGGSLGLEPYTQPGSYLSRAGNVAEVITKNSAAGRWKLVPGLADLGCVSFEQSTAPGVYLRHATFLLWAATSDGSAGFSEDATFCFRDGLAKTGIELRSLESLNFPGYYATLPSGTRGALEPMVDSSDFRARATWILDGD